MGLGAATVVRLEGALTHEVSPGVTRGSPWLVTCESREGSGRVARRHEGTVGTSRAWHSAAAPDPNTVRECPRQGQTAAPRPGRTRGGPRVRGPVASCRDRLTVAPSAAYSPFRSAARAAATRRDNDVEAGRRSGDDPLLLPVLNRVVSVVFPVETPLEPPLEGHLAAYPQAVDKSVDARSPRAPA